VQYPLAYNFSMVNRAVILSAIFLAVPAYATEFKGSCKLPVHCDSVAVDVQHEGHTTVMFSNGSALLGSA
jgi:hypothetical protein